MLKGLLNTLRGRKCVIYECPSCKATKTLMQGDEESKEAFYSRLPPYLLCGYRGCLEYALRTDRFDSKESQ